MAGPYRTQRLVEFHDTDMAGVAHFTAFFRYMESAEHELLRSLGLSVFSGADDQDGAISFPRVSARCDYRAPARCEDVLDIEVNVVRVGAKSVSYEFSFSLEGNALASGQMTSVCCRIVPDKPPESIPIPLSAATKLRELVENVR